jgi:hypothetical protein
MHRAVRDGRMIEFEYLRIEESGGTLVYLSMPSGRSPATPFTLKEQIGERVTFENLAHDFPQRIIYWRDGDTLHTRIEGNADGRSQSREWHWTRSALAP